MAARRVALLLSASISVVVALALWRRRAQLLRLLRQSLHSDPPRHAPPLAAQAAQPQAAAAPPQLSQAAQR